MTQTVTKDTASSSTATPTITKSATYVTNPDLTTSDPIFHYIQPKVPITSYSDTLVTLHLKSAEKEGMHEIPLPVASTFALQMDHRKRWPSPCQDSTYH